jgi:hypothetical protein
VGEADPPDSPQMHQYQITSGADESSNSGGKGKKKKKAAATYLNLYRYFYEKIIHDYP